MPRTLKAPRSREEIEVARQYGRQLKATRMALDVTAAEVAAVVDVTSAAVSNWERGVSLPGFYTSLVVREFLINRAKARAGALKRFRFHPGALAQAESGVA